jgi:hypothetical protein
MRLLLWRRGNQRVALATPKNRELATLVILIASLIKREDEQSDWNRERDRANSGFFDNGRKEGRNPINIPRFSKRDDVYTVVSKRRNKWTRSSASPWQGDAWTRARPLRVSTTLAGTCAQETVLDEGRQAENKTRSLHIIPPYNTHRESRFLGQRASLAERESMTFRHPITRTNLPNTLASTTTTSSRPPCPEVCLLKFQQHFLTRREGIWRTLCIWWC